MQTTNHVLMVRPANFCGNPQTSGSNAFQRKMDSHVMSSVAAMKEFDAYSAKLREAGIVVTIIEDTASPVKPDACFPNNWFTTHPDGKIILYPMAAANRRLERRPEVIKQLVEQFLVTEIIDLSPAEIQYQYHEGTGVMVCDHQAKVAYVCRSPRASDAIMSRVTHHTGDEGRWFDAVDQVGTPIYHTNVMMSVGKQLAFLCTDAIRDHTQQQQLLEALSHEGRIVMTLTHEQMSHFCGNVLELHRTDGSAVLALSSQAWQHFLPAQRRVIETHAEPVIADLTTIETLGGGGARCMLAEIFLTPRDCNSANQEVA